MQVAIFALALALLAPQAVHALFTQITFSSVAQCGSFQVEFSGGSAPTALPLSLTILPFNSSNPVIIPIPLNSWNETSLTGAAVTFVPLAVGTNFIASLDDANGEAAGSVSDVIRVLSSDDNSCVLNSTQVPREYTQPSGVSQCQPFIVKYNEAAHPNPITVRRFIPRGSAIPTNASTDSESVDGESSFVMDAFRGKQVLLLVSDGKTSETSPLLAVGGDSESSNDCFARRFNTGNDAPKATVSSGISKNLIIIIGSSVGAVLFLVSLCLVAFLVRDRRRRRGQQRLSGDDDGRYPFSEKSEKAVAASVPADGRIIRNPPYATSPTASEFIDYNDNRRDYDSLHHISVSSNTMAPQGSTPFPTRTSAPLMRQDLTQQPRPYSGSAETIASLDIEHILDMATIYASPRESGIRAGSMDPTSMMFKNMVLVSPQGARTSPTSRVNAFPTSMAFTEADQVDYAGRPELAVFTTQPLRLVPLANRNGGASRLSSGSQDSSVVDPSRYSDTGPIFSRYSAESSGQSPRSVHQRVLSKTGYSPATGRPTLPSSPRPNGSGRLSLAPSDSFIEPPRRALTRDSAGSGYR